MTITTKIIRKGNTGYRKVYFSTRRLKEGTNCERRKFSDKYNKRWNELQKQHETEEQEKFEWFLKVKLPHKK